MKGVKNPIMALQEEDVPKLWGIPERVHMGDGHLTSSPQKFRPDKQNSF